MLCGPDPPPPAPNQGCHVDCTPCVPIESDVDCEGGSCDGPAYVRGPVTAIGPDAYRLDGDNNGIGREQAALNSGVRETWKRIRHKAGVGEPSMKGWVSCHGGSVLSWCWC